MKLYLLFLTLITGVACGRHGRGSYIHAIEKCNEYVDDLLVTAVNESNLEDYKVYGRELTFNKKVVFYNFKVSANLTEGHIIGFGNLRRKSPCSLSFINGRIKLNVQLEVKEIKCKFTAVMDAIGTSTAHVSAITSPLKIDLSFTFNAASGGNGSLDNYMPHVISNMKVWVDSLGYLDFLKQPMEESAEDLFYDLINTVTYADLRNSLVSGIRNNDFPVKDLEIDDVSSTEPTEITTLTTPQSKKELTKEDSDNYIDIVLVNRYVAESKYSKMDPYALNDVRLDNIFVRQQEVQEEGQNYIKLEKGLLKKLLHLKRRQHCTKPKFSETNVTFSCSLGFDELEMKYVAEAHNDTEVYNFNLVATILQTRFTVKITSNYIDNVPSLQEYIMNDSGKISIKAAVDIIGGVDHSPPSTENLYNSKVILKFVSEELNSVLKGRLKEVLSYSIFKTPLPFLAF